MVRARISACASALVVIASVVGCGAPAMAGSDGGADAGADPTSPGDYAQTIASGGLTRTYLLHIPTGYDGSTALPLVMVLHGGGGSAEGMVMSTGFNTKADTEGFVVAYLNGTGDPQAWNNGIAPNLTVTADDVGFVRDLVNKLEAQLDIDAHRVYVAGFSNGGFMSHRLAAELPDLIAAVAVAEGTVGIRQSDGNFLDIVTPTGPIPVLIMHGRADTNIPYDGGMGANAYVRSVADAVTFWTTADGCTGTPMSQTSPDGNLTTQTYATCQSGAEVRLHSIVSGEHAWPTLRNAAQFAGTEAAWAFFSRHTLP